jgi:hypothetical protein
VQAAKDLFESARKHMADEDYARAAEELEESLRLFHGKGTLFNLAVCYEHLGRLASAWSLYVEVADAAAQAGEMEREHVAREAAAAIASHVPHLIVQVADGTPDLVVRRDSAVLGPSTWGVPLPVDPGQTIVKAAAPGRQEWQQPVTLQIGESQTVHVPVLEPAPVPERASPPQAIPVAPPVAGAPETASPSAIGRQRAFALVVAGAGVVALGVGSYYGLKSLGEWPSTSCPDGKCSSPDTIDRQRSSTSDGDVSTWAFVAGGVLAAGAAVLWLTGGPDDRPASPPIHVGVGPGGVRVAGTF